MSESTREWLNKSRNFAGKLGETYADISPGHENLILVGLGKRDEFDYDALRTMAFKAMKTATDLHVEKANFIIPEMEELADPLALKAIFEGALQNDYRFDKYKTLDKKEDTPDLSICLEAQWMEGKEEILEEVKTMMEGVTIARDLVNESPSDMTPERFAQFAKETLEPVGVTVTVYDEEEITKMGMTAFLAVARGSANPPRFIKMEYLPNGPEEKSLVYVGKGLMFDSGGYSLKPAKSMVDMKSDMSGAAAVVGAMYALGKNKGARNVVALVAACENMISGAAYKPGDIVSTLSGKTIEVLNTDAEGRVTLADALYYAATECNAEAIIDAATLTGACVVALGSTYTGAVANDEDLYNDIKRASNAAGELIWLMPSHDTYRDMIKGNLADLQNISEGGAGTITAGLFLEHFVNDVPWVHLDIAGTAFLTKPERYLPKGATGVLVKTFYELGKE